MMPLAVLLDESQRPVFVISRRPFRYAELHTGLSARIALTHHQHVNLALTALQVLYGLAHEKLRCCRLCITEVTRPLSQRIRVRLHVLDRVAVLIFRAVVLTKLGVRFCRPEYFSE
jgi:hypothetical protein